ncbi:MAG: APC family permease [Candidatus Acidiferrales bacterium]
MSAGERSPENNRSGLVRELGLADGVSLVVGSIIGSGIFLVPQAVAQQLSSFSAVLLVWVAGGALTLFGALSLAELGAAYPRAGGLYVYLSHAYGRPAGFLYGWGLLAMIHSGSIATLAVAFGLYLGRLLPLGAEGEKAAGLAAVLLLTGVNCFGLRAGKRVQNFFTAAKLGGLGLMTAVLLWRGRPVELFSERFWPAEGARWEWLPFGVALVGVLWAYEGWHVVSFTAGEVREPARNLPRSLLYGALIIAGIYLLANAAYYSVLSGAEVAGSETVAASATTRAAGPAAGGLISLLILVSIFGAMNGMVLSGPRVYYAMARDGLFFSALGRLHPRWHAPVTALAVQGVWAAALAMVGTFRELFTYVVFTAWIFYGATVAGVIVLRRREPAVERPFRVPGYPWVSLLFTLAALGLTVSTMVAAPGNALRGIGLILLGVPLYWLFRRRERRT